MPVFMLTDIEGSSGLWEKHRDLMGAALSRHDAILAGCVTKYGGTVVKHTGDGMFAVFAGGNPLGCALAMQYMLGKEDWGDLGELRIRIALHAGQAEQRGDDYYGLAVNRTSRILTSGWGGQILCSPDAKDTCALPRDASWLDLGVHQLKDLSDAQHIFQLCHPLLKLQTFPALRTLSAHPQNLPPQSTPFLGREKELEELIALLDDPKARLITILGPGGIGKTRLGLQAASETVERFRYGAYFVPLAPIESPDVLVTAIADALKFSFYMGEDHGKQLSNYLREKEILLVLDNFEHVIESSPIVSELLAAAPGLNIIATSRERLNLAGETLYELRGMDTPPETGRDNPESYDAVRLFLQSVARMAPDFKPCSDDLACIVTVCRKLDGLPLGIELASALLRVMSCQELSREIEQNLDILESTQRDLPDRHRSLRGVFEYSWKLLDDAGKRAFRRLSVFRGRFTKQAAHEVADIGLMLMAELVDKSLLIRHPDGSFSIHGMLRHFAKDKLAADVVEQREMNTKHCRFYLRLLGESEEDFCFGRNSEKTQEVREKAEDLRAAWLWAVDNDEDELMQGALPGFYEYLTRSGRLSEGRELLGQALTKQLNLGEKANSLLAERLKARIAGIEIEQSEFEKAGTMLKIALNIAHDLGDMREKAFILKQLGDMAQLQGSFDKAFSYFTVALEIYRELGDDWNLANILNYLGIIAYRRGEIDEAVRLYTESRQIRTRIGDLVGVAGSLNNLANMADYVGDYHEALRLQTESLRIKRELDERRAISNSLNGLGNIMLSLGNYSEAEKYYRESLEIRLELGDPLIIATSYNNLGRLSYLLRFYDKAMDYYQKSLEIRRRIKDKPGIVSSLNNIVESRLEAGDTKGALEAFSEGLELSIKIKSASLILGTLTPYAYLLFLTGKCVESLRLSYFLLGHPASEQERKDYIRDKYLPLLESQLSLEARQRIQEETKSSDLEKMCRELLESIRA
jgi:predicted ATPase/class 3 adenylate cyclase